MYLHLFFLTISFVFAYCIVCFHHNSRLTFISQCHKQQQQQHPQQLQTAQSLQSLPHFSQHPGQAQPGLIHLSSVGTIPTNGNVLSGQPQQLQSQGLPLPMQQHSQHHVLQNSSQPPLQVISGQGVPLHSQVANYENQLSHLPPAGAVIMSSAYPHGGNEFQPFNGNQSHSYQPATIPSQPPPNNPSHLHSHHHHPQQHQHQQLQLLQPQHQHLNSENYPIQHVSNSFQHAHRGGELKELNRVFTQNENELPPQEFHHGGRGKLVKQFGSVSMKEESPLSRVPVQAASIGSPNGNPFSTFQEQLQIHQQQQQQLQEIQIRQGRQIQSVGGQIPRLRSPQQVSGPARQFENVPLLPQFHQGQPHRHQLARDTVQYSAEQDLQRKLKTLVSENGQLISENEYYKQHLQSLPKDQQNVISLQREINDLNLMVQQLNAQLQIQTEETKMWTAREREMSLRCKQLYEQAQRANEVSQNQAFANQEREDLLVKIYNLEGDARNQQRQIEELNACLQFYKDSFRTQQVTVPNSMQLHSRNSSQLNAQQQQMQQQQQQQQQSFLSQQKQVFEVYPTNNNSSNNSVIHQQQQQQLQQHQGLESGEQVYSSPRHRDEMIQSILQQYSAPPSSAQTQQSLQSQQGAQQQSQLQSQSQSQLPLQKLANVQVSQFVSPSSGVMIKQAQQQQQYQTEQESKQHSDTSEAISDWKQHYNRLTQQLNSLSTAAQESGSSIPHA